MILLGIYTVRWGVPTRSSHPGSWEFKRLRSPLWLPDLVQPAAPWLFFFAGLVTFAPHTHSLVFSQGFQKPLCRFLRLFLCFASSSLELCPTNPSYRSFLNSSVCLLTSARPPVCASITAPCSIAFKHFWQKAGPRAGLPSCVSSPQGRVLSSLWTSICFICSV